MILLGSEFDTAGITVLRDHLVSNLFHCLPAKPRVLDLELLRYRGAAAGGVLTLEVDLAHDPAVLATARAALIARSGGGSVELVPVLFTEGSVNLVVLGTSQKPDSASATFLVRQVLGTARPSLLAAARASFSVALDAEGATLVAAAMQTTGAPVVVAYDLTVTGLQPARGSRARVQYHMGYEFLRTRFAGNALVFKADIDTESEALSRSGAITIEDVDYTGTDPTVLAQRRDDILQTLRDVTRAVYFQPAPSPSAFDPAELARVAGADATWTRQGRPQAAFLLRELRQDEQQTLVYDYSEAQLGTMRIAPQGALRLPAGRRAAHCIRDATLEEPSADRRVHVRTAPDADWRGIDAIEVTLEAANATRTVVLTARPPAVENLVMDAAGRSAAGPDPVAQGAVPDGQFVVLQSGPITYRVVVHATAAPGDLGVPASTAPMPRTLETDDLVLDPGVLAVRRVLRVALGVVDPVAVRGVQGRFLAADGTAVNVLLDAARPEQTLVVWGADVLRLEAVLVGPSQSDPLPPRTIDAQETVVVVNQPADRYATIQVALQDPLERFASVQVELEAPGGQRRSLSLNAAEPSARWSVLRAGGHDAAYRYRTVKLARDASVQQEDWRDAAGSLLVVGDLDVRMETIEVLLAGITGAQGALVTLTSLDPPPGAPASIDTVLDTGQFGFRVSLPFRRAAERRYHVEGIVMRDTGEEPIPQRIEDAETLVLLLVTPPTA